MNRNSKVGMVDSTGELWAKRKQRTKIRGGFRSFPGLVVPVSRYVRVTLSFVVKLGI